MKEVANQLDISTRTAESYKYNLMNALGIRTNTERVQHVIKVGLITITPFNTAVWRSNLIARRRPGRTQQWMSQR